MLKHDEQLKEKTMAANSLRTIHFGTQLPLLAGDTVWAEHNSRLVLAIVLARCGKKLSLRLEGKPLSAVFDLPVKEVTPLRLANRLPLEVGARVVIRQHKHLKCARHGTIQYIDGGYISVLPDATGEDEGAGSHAGSHVGSLAGSSSNFPLSLRCFELYDSEIKVIAVFRHKQFLPGSIIKINDFDWGRTMRRTYGVVLGIAQSGLIVQPIGASKGKTISLPVESAEFQVTEQLDLEEVRKCR